MTSRADRFFRLVTARPQLVLIAGIAAIAWTVSFLPQLQKDTTADGFIDPDDPALIYRDRVEEIFGLKDPIVVALFDETSSGVFRPETLAGVRELSRAIEELDNVDPERVVSLATEKNIVGTDDGMIVEEFFDEQPEAFRAPLGSAERAAEIRRAIETFPLYQGSLVARDGSATVIVAELLDDTRSEQTYDEVVALVAATSLPEGVSVHVAGEAAVSGYLSTYIDQDASRLNPLAAVVITVVLGICFMSFRGAFLPNVIVLGTVAGAIGLMAASGTPFYVITNGLIVNLIGIAVADSIHVFSQYYEELRADSEAPNREIVIRAMTAMWRPVTLTSVTTGAGFLALAASAGMPPIRYFGVFGAVGVGLAWLYSVTLLPAMMVLWSRKRLPRAFRAADLAAQPDPAVHALARLGGFVLDHPRAIAVGALGILLVGLLGAARIVVDESRITNFQTEEPIYRADQAINQAMDGTYYLDVLVETPEREALHQPENLRSIESLQEFLASQPHVNGSTSIVDYLKQMHRAVNENRIDAYRVPEDPMLVSQLLLLYHASGDPTDFEEEVDYGYQQALVRARVDRGDFSTNRVLVPAVEHYLQEEFDRAGIRGTVTGRLNVDYHWIRNIASNHARSVAFSLAAVFAMTALLFRSWTGAALACIPVVMAVLLVYAVMGWRGIWLGVGTSMFAAIAIGLGVDFGIHSIDRLQERVRSSGWTRDALLGVFRSTGRALFFNFIAVALGFGVLLSSDVPPLVRFGSLVALAVSTAFVASVTLVPALAWWLRPGFLVGHSSSAAIPGSTPARAAAVGALLLLASSVEARAEAPVDTLSGDQIMARVNQRDDGLQVSRKFTLELTDRRGITRVEKTTGYRKYFGDEKRTIFFYTDPTNVRGTGFLTFDYPELERDDDQWLYLPALRKVRRISASDRGDYFLGTDLTYEEVKKEQKVELSDYRFEAAGKETVDGIETRVVKGIPINDRIADELGYSRVIWRVDPEIWMSRLSDYYDPNGNHLKTIHLESVETVDGIDTATRIFVQNHKTGHSTRLTFSDIDYEAKVDDRVFSQNRLRRGL